MSSAFKPQKQKVYLVEFVIVGAGCEQHVYDITDPAQRIPVLALSTLLDNATAKLAQPQLKAEQK